MQINRNNNIHVLHYTHRLYSKYNECTLQRTRELHSATPRNNEYRFISASPYTIERRHSQSSIDIQHCRTGHHQVKEHVISTPIPRRNEDCHDSDTRSSTFTSERRHSILPNRSSPSERHPNPAAHTHCRNDVEGHAPESQLLSW